MTQHTSPHPATPHLAAVADDPTESLPTTTPPASPPRPAFRPLRVGDAERARVADQVARHYAEGRLSSLEMEERISLAMAAVTTHDLREITADLPRLSTSPQAPQAFMPVMAPAPAPNPTRSLLEGLLGFFTASAIFCTAMLLLMTATGANSETGFLVWLGSFGTAVSVFGLTYFAMRRNRSSSGGAHCCVHHGQQPTTQRLGAA